MFISSMGAIGPKAVARPQTIRAGNAVEVVIQTRVETRASMAVHRVFGTGSAMGLVVIGAIGVVPFSASAHHSSAVFDDSRSVSL